ncbi:hypothetical protein C2S51_027413 [Perilla frutescens var. frutescens]|nr:hypothetical protein C2S51_027413 [Perilla frutescens var. frutescens]
MVTKVRPDRVTVVAVLSSCARLGRLDMGRAIHDHDLVSWSSVISGLALQLFSDILREGIRPIHGTFVGVLLACVRSDLFCRSGNLTRAHEFIKNMPIVPDVAVWRIFLSSCQIHDDLVLAKIASDKLLELDPTNGIKYALSSNSYVSAERWDNVMKVRELMGKRDVQKLLGWSSMMKCPDTHNIFLNKTRISGSKLNSISAVWLKVLAA